MAHYITVVYNPYDNVRVAFEADCIYVELPPRVVKRICDLMYYTLPMPAINKYAL